MKSRNNAGQSKDKTLHTTQNTTAQYGMQTHAKKERKKKKKHLEERKPGILLSQLLVQIPLKGRAETFPWQLLLSLLPSLACPSPARKGPESQGWKRMGKTKKQVGCRRADISIRGMTSPQAVTRQQTPARQQVAKGDAAFMFSWVTWYGAGRGGEIIYKPNPACLFPLSH